MTPAAPPDWARDVDLDDVEPASVTRPDTLLALCVALALVGVLAAAALHSVLTPTREAEPARALVTLDLLDVVATPLPAADLALTVLNRGNVALITESTQLDGAGLTPTTTGLAGRVEAGGEQVLHVRAALDCRPDAARATPPRVLVRLRPDDGQRTPARDVVAVGVGDAGTVGGLCLIASRKLPSDAEPVLTVSTARFEGDRLHLVVAGAPDGARLITGRAAGWLLPAEGDRPATVVSAGRVDTILQAPVPGCRDTGALDVVPSGVQLVLVLRDGGLQPWYAPIGPELAGWLLDAYDRACPSPRS